MTPPRSLVMATRPSDVSGVVDAAPSCNAGHTITAVNRSPGDPQGDVEHTFMDRLLELAGKLARAGAIAEVALLSVDGMAHGESVSLVESLGLHVKALELITSGIDLSNRLASLTHPPRLDAAVAEALAQCENLRSRFPSVLQSAELCRKAVTLSHLDGSATSSSNFMETGSSRINDSAQRPVHTVQRLAVKSKSGKVFDDDSDGHDRNGSVCVEEVLYRQALCMGREAAVDELLGHYEASATLYTRAKLTLEQLAVEPMIGEADRTVLLKYGAGFTWRLHELRTKMRSAVQ